MKENNQGGLQQVRVKNAVLSPEEAAHYLGVEVGTLSVWRCTKRYALPYIKVGRLVRYRVDDLEAFLSSRTVPAGA